jgi:hypothetical protein
MFTIYNVDSEENRKTRVEYEKSAKFNGFRVFDTRFVEGGSDIDLCTEWLQLGADILGYSVSLSGDSKILAVGSLNTGGSNEGYTQVYEWKGNSWSQLGGIITTGNNGDSFGNSVSLSCDGKRLAIGAPDYNNSGFLVDVGLTRIYDWDGNSWTQVGGDIEGETSGEQSGYSVSLSCDGKRVAIGARYHNNNTINLAGCARIYELDGQSWTQVGGDIDGEASNDFLGTSVSMSGDGNMVAVGAPGYDNGTTSNIGLTRVYKWDGNVWDLIGGDILGVAAEDSSGGSVSLSGDGKRVAVGAPGYDSSKGLTRVYERDDMGFWGIIGGDILGVASGDVSGFSVNLSGDGKRVAVGAPGYDGNRGLTRVYEWDGNVWNLIGGDIFGETAGDASGFSVSLGDDGERVGTGAYKFETVRVYEC